MSLVSLQKCPICKGTTFQDQIKCQDHTTSKETFTIASCTSCGLLATTPRPSGEHLDQYYLSPEYVSHTGGSKSAIDRLYMFARKKTLRWKYKLISKIKEPGLLLDFGCGTGEFLNEMKQAGWQVRGVEPSPVARSKATALLMTPLTVASSLAKLPNGQYDVITMWHVLEHIEEIESTLQDVHHVLKQDGVIFVAVPNHESHDAKHYREHWAGYDVPRHLWHFSKTAIQRLFENHGLELQQIIPMKLDAYYVSLLSENYLHPKSKISSSIRACYQGFLSNLKAKQNCNYSSLIYVFQHA